MSRIQPPVASPHMLEAGGTDPSAIPSHTRVTSVQMEDGTVEHFLIDKRTDPSRLPQVLAGAIRARQRQKKGLPKEAPDKGVDSPSLLPPTVGAGVVQAIKGLASIPAGIAKEFVEGAKIINKSPLHAASLLPEAVEGPKRASMQAFQAAMSTPQSESQPITGVPGVAMMAGGPLTAALAALGPERSKNLVKAIPGIGQMADQLGEQAAEGKGVEALSNVAGNVALSTVAGKGTITRNAPKAKAPTPTPPPLSIDPAAPPPPRQVMPLPDQAGQARRAGNITKVPEIPESRIPEVLPEIVPAQLPEYMRAELSRVWNPNTARPYEFDIPQPKAAKSPVQKSLRIPMPFTIHGLRPSISVSSSRTVQIKNFLNSAKGSAQEAFWAQQLIRSGGEDDKEGHPPSPNTIDDADTESGRNILGFEP